MKEFIKSCLENEQFVKNQFDHNNCHSFTECNLLIGFEQFLFENFKNKISQSISEKINSIFKSDLNQNVDLNMKESNPTHINSQATINRNFQYDFLVRKTANHEKKHRSSDENSSNSTSLQSKGECLKRMILKRIPKDKYLLKVK